MSKRAEAAALKAYPNVVLSNYPDTIGGYEQYLHDDCSNVLCRKCYQQGYEQAEKDTIERACDILMNYVFEEVTPEMRDHFRKRLEEE